MVGATPQLAGVAGRVLWGGALRGTRGPETAILIFMGNVIGRVAASSSEAAQRVPNKFTAAPHAEAYVRAAKEKAAAAAAAAARGFPEMPDVPSHQRASGSRPPLSADMEMEANRGIVELLNQSSILTRAEPTTSSGGGGHSADGVESKLDDGSAAQPGGLAANELMAALVLHAQQPDRWTAAALAQKYDIADREASLASALAHVRPYTVVEEDGRFVGVAVSAASVEASTLSAAEKSAMEHARIFEESNAQQGTQPELPPSR